MMLTNRQNPLSRSYISVKPSAVLIVHALIGITLLATGDLSPELATLRRAAFDVNRRTIANPAR